MGKRRKPAAKADLDFPDWLMAAAEEDAGLGVSDHYLDRAPWLPEHGPDAPWYTALEKLDTTGDKTLLLDLLESDQELSRNIRYHIANLLKRHKLRRLPGKQATPSYDFSHANTGWWLACEAMRSLVRNGMRVRDAAEACATSEITAQILESAYQGKHAGFARAKAAKRPKK